MNRAIKSFAQDEEEHWVARLSCGHSQHTRNNPPIVERPWVLSEEGRSQKIGTDLDCVRCDRFEMPDGYAPYQRTPDFTQETVPEGLLKDHSTKAGVWALIHVVKGKLRYSIKAPLGSHRDLSTESEGVVLPEVLHRVEALGEVVFYVEFWKAK